MMRVLIVVTALALAAPAAAQSPYALPRPASGYGVPAPPSPYGAAPSGSGRTGGYGNPASQGGGFKPYEGFKGSSVYSAPKAGPSGAKPC